MAGVNEGRRFHAERRRGARNARVSFITTWYQHTLVTPMTYEGYCHRAVFETCLEKGLLPSLHPGKVIICDNATFHKGGRIQTLIEQAGCRL